MKRRRIAVIGYGAIAPELIALLLAADASVAVILASSSRSRGAVPETCALLDGDGDLAAFAPDLIVEAAGHGAVRERVPGYLALGLPVLISSVGALHDEALYRDLAAAAHEHGGRLLLPSGALGGLDYIRAVRGAPDLALRYESRKPPAAWRAELEALDHDPASLTGPLTLFEGTAREAAALYPQNLNVAAALALAGPGFGATKVAVVCDPAATGNSHVVTAQSHLGSFRAEIANAPSPANPKTSLVVAHALKAAIEQYFAPVQML